MQFSFDSLLQFLMSFGWFTSWLYSLRIWIPESFRQRYTAAILQAMFNVNPLAVDDPYRSKFLPIDIYDGKFPNVDPSLQFTFGLKCRNPDGHEFIYSGQIDKKGWFKGFGRFFVFSTGYITEGTFKNGLPDGRVRTIFASGETFIG